MAVARGLLELRGELIATGRGQYMDTRTARQLGYGLLLEQADGRPGLKIWAFVDDFAIYGPDLEMTLFTFLNI